MAGMPEASDLGVVPGGRALGHLSHGRVEKEVREVAVFLMEGLVGHCKDFCTLKKMGILSRGVTGSG